MCKNCTKRHPRCCKNVQQKRRGKGLKPRLLCHSFQEEMRKKEECYVSLLSCRARGNQTNLLHLYYTTICETKCVPQTYLLTYLLISVYEKLYILSRYIHRISCRVPLQTCGHSLSRFLVHYRDKPPSSNSALWMVSADRTPHSTSVYCMS